jgi:GntR family transcriptional repressor for pyruvate dehydrogenase complex
MIADHDFSPGDKFFSEKELTEKLGVSRSSVREAIRILEATGHVKVRHGRGIFIANSTQEKFEAFSDWLKNNEQSILDHFEVRLILEPEVAWKAAGNADADDVRELEQAWKQFRSFARGSHTEESIRSDRQFHKLLAKSTKNKTLFFLMKTFASSLPDGWICSLHTPGRIEKTVEEHGRILTAVKNRDALTARHEMRSHLENALADIKSSMKKQ